MGVTLSRLASVQRNMDKLDESILSLKEAQGMFGYNAIYNAVVLSKLSVVYRYKGDSTKSLYFAEKASEMGLCKTRTGWRRMADGGWRMTKCGWESADGKVRMIKCGWENEDGKMRMGKFGWDNADGKMQMGKYGWENVDGKMRMRK